MKREIVSKRTKVTVDFERIRATPGFGWLACFLLLALVLAGCRPPTPTPLAALTETPPPTEPVEASPTPSPDPPITLQVPTLYPYPTPEPTERPAVSGIRRIVDEGVLRVGIKLNEPPFGMLDREGNIVGYDADIARALAESWGVTLTFVQVTNQTAIDYLLSGEVDLLLAAMPHRREHEAYMDFSQSYFASGQAALARADAGISAVGDLNGRSLAVVAGSTALEALFERDISAPLLVVETMDEALAALTGGEVDAVIDSMVRLRRAKADLGDAVNLLDELLNSEPFAVGIRRFDVNLRNALNRTLQALESGGRMAEIHGAWFPGYTYPGMVTWESDDARAFAEYPTDITYGGSVVSRIAQGEALYVAGLGQPGDPEQGALEGFYRALVEAMAARWGVQVEFLPESSEQPGAWVADGRAQLAVGAQPRWDGADAVDYSQGFLLHGDRLVVPENSDIRGFGDMRGKRVAVFGENAARAEERANELALSVRVRLAGVAQVEDAETALRALNQRNVDAIFGDSLALGPLVEANSDRVRFTERFYSRHGVAFAVPRNDADFRALVNFTLQDLVREGVYDRIYAESLGWAEPLPVEIWPGDDSWLGLGRQ